METSYRGRLDALLALALLAPAAVLAWPGPGAPLFEDLLPELSGAGWAAWAALPAALLAPWVAPRRPRTDPAGGARLARLAVAALLVFVACFAASTLLQTPTDTLEADRARLGLATALVALLAGARLGARGATWLARGAGVVTLVLCVHALLQAHGLFVGVLGNTGALSEAALPGALAGAWLAARGEGGWGRLGGAALLVHAFYAGVVPVHAGALSLGLALVLGALALRGRGVETRRFVVLAVLALVACGVGTALRTTFPGTRPSSNEASRTDASSALDGRSADDGSDAPRTLGGFEVRLRIARTLPDMVAAGGLLGAGPGQFLAAYPPYRDREELELSSLGREPGLERVVAHPHDDWLLPLVETGPLGGLAFLLFGACTALACLRALRLGSAEDPIDGEAGALTSGRAALALGCLGVGINAFLRAPLFANPAASSLAFAFAGAVLAGAGAGASNRAGSREGDDADDGPAAPSAMDAGAEHDVRASRRGALALRAGTLIALALLALQLPRAAALVAHGRALASRFAAGDEAGLRRALDARADSSLARALEARRLEASDPEAARELWRGVRRARPFDVEALMQLGKLEAEAGRYEPARVHLLSAERVDPGHPALARNLALLELRARRGPEALARVDRLIADGGLEPERLLAWTVERLTALDLEAGEALLERCLPSSDPLTAERAYARAPEVELEHPDLARALRGTAHALWARRHAAAESWSLAVRSYRQAWSALAATHAGRDERFLRPLRAELAAALWRADDADGAREWLESGALAPAEAQLAAPPWVAAALAELDRRPAR